MRQPSSTRRYGEIGQLPTSNAHHAHGRRGTPEVVIQNGERWEQEEKEQVSHNKMRTTSPINSKIGSANNPNRADMPKSTRKTSYDPVSDYI